MTLVPWATGAQTLEDYTYSTGVDASKWIIITDSTNLLGTGNADGRASSLQSIGFNFPFAEDTYTQFSVNSDGNLRLGSIITSTSSYSTPFNTNANSNNPKINFLGCDGYFLDTIHYVYAENTIDANNNSFLCVEFCLGTFSSATRAQKYKWQVHLYPNGNIQVVMAPTAPTTAPALANQKGLCVNSGDGWIIDSDNIATHFSTGSTTTWASGTWPAPNTYYSFTRPFISCPKPAMTTASNISPNSFDFSWTDLSSATSWHVQLLQDSTIVSDNVETFNSVSFTGLSSNTLYTVRVAGICGPGDTSLFKTKTLRTACNFITTLPYENGFENDPYYSASSYADAFPYCWTRINDASGTYNYYPYITTTSNYVHNGTKGMYWYHTTTTTYADNEIAVLPGIDTSVNNISDLTLSFYAKTTSTSYHPQPIVGVMTDPTDASTFTPVHTFSSTDITTTWQLFSIPLANFTGYGNYIAIKWPRPSSICYLAIDDIFVTNEWCNPPQNVTATSTLDEVTISWTGSDDYSYRVILNDDTVTGITDHFYTFANLTPNTQYEYSVATECASSTSLNLSGSIRTRCYLLDSVPYTMGFEASEGVNTGSTTSNDFVNCWFHLNNGTDYFGYPDVASNSTYNHTPNGVQGLYWYNTTTQVTYGDYQIVVLPGVDTNIYPTTTLQLSFWARASSASYYPTFTVGVMTDPNDINTFVLVDTVNIGNSTAWNEYTTSLASYNGSGNYVALRADRPTSSWYAYVDDITLEMIPDCPHVENIAAHSITTNSAELSWHETGSATNWEITYLSDGTPSDLAVTMTVTDTNATLTGLQPNTHYYVWITPICPGYVRPQFISFRTNCNFLDSLPYSMSFESWEGVSTGSSSNPNFANCWHRLNNGTSYFGYPYVNSSSNYNHTPNGVQGLYWYNSTTLNTYGDYQVVVLPAVDIYQYPLRTLQLSFWARSTSTSYYPVFTVGVMSDPNDINTFVAVDTIHVDNSTAWGEYITSLESYSGNGTFVALRADRTSAYWYACVDDITLSVRSCGLHANRLPYFDNFDNYTVSTTAKTGVEPPCWTLVHQDVAMTDEYKPMLYYNPDNAHSGDYSLLLNKRGIYAMPYIDTNINNLKLSFYLKQQQTKYQLQVGVMSDLNDPNTFEPFTTIDNSSTNVEFVEVDFSSYTGDGHYIAFHNILAPGYNGDYSCNYIDDLTLYLPSYTVTANTSDGGFVTGAGTYFKGSTCSLSAIADSGFAFLNWTCGNQVVSTQTEYIFTVSSDTTLTANFARTYTINATVYPEGAGTVYGTGTYIEGSTYTLTAIPNEGYVFFDYDRHPHAGCNFRLSNTLQEEANSDIEYTAFYLIAHQTDVPDNVPTNGLIAYYPFENNADDYSGNNHHGLMYEEVEYQPQPTQDRFGNDNSAYLFNDNFIQVPLANPLFDSCVTVSFWVQQSLSDTAITTYGGDGNRINMYSAIIDGQIDVGSSGEGGSGLSIYLSKRDSANAEVQKIQYGSLNPAINCYTVPKWIHYVIVADSNRRSIYRNGSLVADTTSLQLPTHDGDIYFGATRDIKSCYPYYNPFYGKIDDIALYNRALSTEEVLSLYGDYTDTNILYVFDTIIALGSIVWHGNIYSESGDYIYGCDTVYHLHLSIHDGCTIQSLPYFDNFDHYTTSTTAKTGVRPPCWTLARQDVAIADEYKPMIYYNTENSHSGDYSLILNKRGIFAMPYLDANISDVKLSFYLKQQQTKYRLQVGVMSDLWDFSTYVPVTTINNSSTDIEFVRVDFSSYTGNGHYIAFRNILPAGNNGDYSINYIDDLTLYTCPTGTYYDTQVLGSYTWHDTSYSASGLYTYDYVDRYGCPITDTLHLTVCPTLSGTAQYSDASVFVQGLNVPHDMLFDTLGNMYVVNHGYNGAYDSLQYTITRIDTAGNIRIVGTDLVFASGMVIDKEQSLYVNQGNGSLNITKIPYGGSQYVWTNLDIQSNTLALFDDGNPDHFRLYAAASWGGGLRVIDHDGNYSSFGNFNRAFILGLSEDGEYLYFDTWNDNEETSTIYRYTYSENTFTPMSGSIFRGVGEWGGIGPDNKCYFTAYSRSNPDNKALYRIDGIESFTEIISDLPGNSEVRAPLWKQNGNTYDLYLGEVVNSNRPNPDDNRIIKFTSLGNYYDWKDTIIVTVCGETEYTWPVNGMTYTENGSYYYHTQTPDGCDSMVILNLFFGGSDTSETIVSEKHFTWHDTTYTESGVYTFGHENEYGCPVTDTLFLTIYNCPKGISDTITATDSYTWHNQSYTESGIYTFLGYVYYEDSIYQVNDIPADAVYYCPIIDTLYLTICNIRIADLPYTDDFDSSTSSTTAKTGVEPNCWTLVHQDVTMSDEYKPMIYYNSDNAHSGDYSLLLNKRGIYAMPIIDTNISDIKLSFYLRQQQTKYRLQVGVIDNLEDPNTFVPVTTIDNSSTDVEYVEVDFSSYTGDGHYIAFRNILAPGYNGDFSCNYIDDLTLSVNYTVTTEVYPANGGMVTGGGIYPAGYTCTMTATAADGYNFLYWTDGSNIVSNQDVYNFTVSSNITLTAVFYVIGSQNHYCPGLKNPMSFTSGATSGAYVGYYSGQTGQKQRQAPNALTGATGVSMFSGIIPANQLANTTGNGGTSYCGNTLDPTKRFRIMSNTDGPGTVLQAGKDPLVNYNLSYCPTAFDPTITKSIRLGNCGYNAEAEALYYTIEVKPLNALLFIYYALVVQSPGHGIEGDPSFVVRVTRRNASNQWQQISDTLFYTVSSYNISDGIDGWHRDGHGYGYVYYHDWDKINIDLSKYLYEQVRIEFYMSDCSASGHYGYCYIAGDCQPMEISIDGCHSGNTQEVATLSAPAGLTNYVWYKCNADGQFISNPYFIPDTVAFTQLTPDSNTNNTYTCTLDDFMITDGENAGQLTNNMVFRCDITSALDPDKPIVTTHYARVINTKPVMAIDSIQSCGGNITLTNRSYVPHETDGCDTAATQWWFYHNGRVDTATGASTSYQFDNSGVYNIKVRSFSRDDHSCYADSTYTVNIIHNTGTFTSITVNTTTPYTWHNQTYDATGTYTFDYTDSNGCPSTDTLHLTIQNDCGIQVSDLPYTDNFDHYTASTTAKTGVEPDCWTLVHQDVAMTDEYKPMVYYNSSNAHSGSYALLLNKRGIYAMPAYEGDISSLQLQFYLKQTQSKYQLQVGVMSDLNDYTTFVPVATFNNTSTTASVLHTVDFASYTGDGHYIAFRNILAHGNTGDFSCNYIDDLTLALRDSSCTLSLSNLPYTDNFDSYTASTIAKTGVAPNCWTLVHQDVVMTDEYKPMVYYNSSNAHSGNYALLLNKRGVYAMPAYEGDVSTLQLQFYLKQTQSKYQLQVGVVSDINDCTTFVPVATFNNTSTSSSVLRTVNFETYIGTGHHIAFRNILAPGNKGDFSCNYIDDLTLSVAGAKNTFDDDSYTDNRHRLALYPNPTTGIITVEADEEVVRVDVFDYTGRNVAVFESQTTLDLSRLAAGIYTLRVTLPERIEVRRVVKQ